MVITPLHVSLVLAVVTIGTILVNAGVSKAVTKDAIENAREDIAEEKLERERLAARVRDLERWTDREDGRREDRDA